MKNNIFIWLILICFLFSTCKEDDMIAPPIPVCDKGISSFLEPAIEIPDSSFMVCISGDDCPFGCEEIVFGGFTYDYSYPVFNPNNADQMAYYRYDNEAWLPTWELWTIDFCTGEQRMLAGNAFYGLDWGSNDWLLYTATDQNIRKIKSNGDSLTQLTFSGDYNRHPKWSPSGDRIIYQHKLGSELSVLILTDKNGNPLDTLDQLTSIGKWSWIDENRIAYMIGNTEISYTSDMKYYDLIDNEVHFLHSLTLEGYNGYLVQNTTSLQNENSILWCAIGLIGKTDISTGTWEIIKERLIHEEYHYLTLRPGTDEIVFNKKSSPVEDCTTDSDVSFYIMNLDGSNVRKVNIE